MDNNLKKIILIFGGGLFLAWAFKKIMPIDVKSKKTSSSNSSASANGEASDDKKKEAMRILLAYNEAKKAGESNEFLSEMNQEFVKEYGMKILTDKGSGKLFVSDKSGNKIV